MKSTHRNRPAGEAGATTPPKREPFPIVCIGASAGGLQALEQILGHAPVEGGLAWIVVQHLDPTHKGMLAELLQRTCQMPVVEATDELVVEPDHVYVIPPNRDMTIVHGTLHLDQVKAPRGLHLPIDLFLRSLADDRQEMAIGVIVSGMGSDGTLGLRALKEKGGAAFAQTPETAEFDSMPRRAIESGVVDVIAPAHELPTRILDYLRYVPSSPAPPEKRGALETILSLLRSHTGNDFSLYKKSTVFRRIERRMGLHQQPTIDDYADFLRANPDEIDLLFKELLIGVTSFFRDAAMWKVLKDDALPTLMAALPRGGILRAWCPGCSTGEEAYSLAMVFKEAVAEVKPVDPLSLQIFATDLDQDAIECARAGAYPPNIVADVSERRLQKFFTKDERGFRVNKEIREMVIFAQQNLVMDPPFTRLDLITCRNLLIYLETELQKRILPLFHFSLNPGGILVLGLNETIGTATDLFVPVHAKMRIYRRSDLAHGPEHINLPIAFSRTTPGEGRTARGGVTTDPNLQGQVEKLLLTRFAPSAVLTTDKGDILFISGRIGRYLEPAAGKVNWNIFAMAREGLGHVMREAFQQAVRRKVPTSRDAQVDTGSGIQGVTVNVQPVLEPDNLRGTLLVVFTETSPPQRRAATAGDTGPEADALQQEVRRAREDLQITREEMQTSQEELQSANEELQSTNEELQSTNEELTTSKEEMQSMNEELQTVNHELQARLDELSRANNDMKNLLDSIDIATLFLDNDLNLRRFTPPVAEFIKLLPRDIGRPVTDFATDLEYPSLADDARQVLGSLVAMEKEVAASEGRWFRVRIMPYRTLDRRIDGVVITFFDIGAAKRVEAQLREANAALQLRVAQPAQDDAS